MRPDSADVVKVGRLSLFVIKRGDKYGIRLKDPGEPIPPRFHGIEYFPASEEYRVTAKFVAEPRKIPILNVLGQTEPSEAPATRCSACTARNTGCVRFWKSPAPKSCSTFSATRPPAKRPTARADFSTPTMPEDGQVVLDFNKAYNPPCAFTPYATCPLPPKENRLAVRIEAGEKKYGH